ncbi:MAG: hypothetical protein AAGG75_00415 [Bacteroidota bacterium]
MLRYAPHLLAIFLQFLFCLDLSAQANIRIGYTYSYFDLAESNAILDRFEEERDWLDNRFGNIRGFHGISFGLRYKMGTTAAELGYYNRFTRRQAEGINPTSSTDFFRQLNTANQGFSLGVEQFIGPFSIGGTIDRNFWTMRLKESSSGDRQTVVDERYWSSQFFVAFNSERTEGISISIRPYVQVPWTSFGLQPLEEALESNPVNDPEEKLLNFGIQFIFYNGN